MENAHENFEITIDYFSKIFEIENAKELILNTESPKFEESICNQYKINVRLLNCFLFLRFVSLNNENKKNIMKYFMKKITKLNKNETIKEENLNSIEYVFF